MADEEAFSDFYNILQVKPSCDARKLESAYHHLAKAHHPDHTGVEDSTDFHCVTRAYKVLRDPRTRAEYDKRYAQYLGIDLASLSGAESGADDEFLSDAQAHDKILKFLYEKRRRTPSDAGVLAFYLQELLQCSYESLEFHQWYLREKGFVALNEQGTLAITIQGIDHVLSTAKVKETERLRLQQFDPTRD
jgi:curved DNA-binding protein